MTTDPTGHATPALVAGEYDEYAAPAEFVDNGATLANALVENARLRERAADYLERLNKLSGVVAQLGAVVVLADDSDEQIAEAIRTAVREDAPSGPQDAETVSDIPQWERDFLDRQEAAERAGAPDQGMVRDAGGRANEELYEALAGAMSALDWAANHISLAYELHLKSVPARTAGDEHLQALRRIAAAHQAPDASPAELADLVEGTAATLDRITAERDKARRGRDSFARRLSVRYQELAEARQAHANQRAAHEQARDDAVAAEAQLAEARQEAERLRGEVDKIADDLDKYGFVVGAHEEVNVQVCAAAFQQYARRLRALASAGGSDTTASTEGSDDDGARDHRDNAPVLRADPTARS